MRDGLTVRARLMGWTMLVTGLILLAVTLWTYQQARERLEREMEWRAVSLVDVAAQQIDAQLGLLQGVVHGMAVALEAQQLAMPFEDARAMQAAVMQQYPGIFGVCIAFDPVYAPADWPDLAAWKYREGDALRYTDLSGDDYAHMRDDWFMLPEVLARPVWSEPYEWEGVLMVTYSVPLYRYDDQGGRQFSGVVTCDLTLDWLEQMIAALPWGEDSYGLLMSRHGTYVAHPMHEIVLNETIFSMAEERDDPELRRIGQRMASGEPGILPFYSFMTGDLSWLAYTPLRSGNWTMAALISHDEMKRAIWTLSRQQIGIGLFGLTLLAVAVWLIARSITRPISALRDAASALSGGDLHVRLPEARGQDEVADLTRTFSAMRDNLLRHMRDLRDTTVVRERMQSELRIAHDIQMGLIPKTFPPFPERDDLDLYAVIEPAREVGGDFYDFFALDDQRMVLAIGDVSGKGVPAALFMAVTRSFLRSTFRADVDPATVLARVNDDLAEGNESCMFVTLFCAVLDLTEGTLRYANAGHNAPLVRRADGALEWITHPHGTIAGAMPGAEYEDGTITLHPNDALVLYTDGVTEAMNEEGSLYEDERLFDSLGKKVCAESCATIIDHLMTDIRAFTQGAEQSDDITIMVVKRGKGVREVSST